MRVLACAVLVILAGCSEAPAEDAADAEAPDAPVDEARREPVLQEVQSVQNITWSGRTKEGAFVCSDQEGTGQCQAGQQVQPDGEHMTTIAYEHNVTAIGLIMDWTPADPSQTGLVLVVYGNLTGEGFTQIGVAQGDAPLRVDVSQPDLVPDSSLTLIVWPEGKTPTSPSVFADATRQDFTVTGDLSLLDREWVVPDGSDTA